MKYKKKKYQLFMEFLYLVLVLGTKQICHFEQNKNSLWGITDPLNLKDGPAHLHGAH